MIPKTDDPQGIDEFRPICLVGYLYRLIAKLLAARLKVVIKKLVSPSQTPFVEGRKMVDGVLFLNEVLDYTKRFKKECLVVKLDFENAFDCVSWDYLCYILSRMGLGLKWLYWMEATMFSNLLLILVNGSPMGDFMESRGLRQGDPLSPFLLFLVAEGSAGLMSNACECGSFRGFHFNDLIHFEMLQFADDIVLICVGSWWNLWYIKAILRGLSWHPIYVLICERVLSSI